MLAFPFSCRFVCAVLLTAVVTCPLLANPDINYETEKRIVQLLSWPAQNDVLQYDVRIDKLVQGRWQQVFQTQTDAPEARISLEPGQYRYRVDVIDLLGRRSPSANWSRLMVMRALQPEISAFSPVFYNINDPADLTLTFKGTSIELNARVALVSASGTRIEAASVDISGNKEEGKAVFKKAALAEGYWALTVINPGGLETSLPTLAIGKPGAAVGDAGAEKAGGRAKALFLFSEGYSLLVPLRPIYGEYFDMDFYPLGAHARFAVLPFQGAYGLFGLELASSWSYLHNQRVIEGASYLTSAHLFSGVINLMYQKKFFNGRFAVNVRAGGGGALLNDIEIQIRKEGNDDPGRNSDQWTFNGESFRIFNGMLAANLGFSFMLGDSFFVEADADFRLMLSGAATKPCLFVPMIALGVVF